MNCKFCNSQLEDGVKLCPVCGKDNTEPVEEYTENAPEKIEEVEEQTAVQLKTEAIVEETTEPAAKPPMKAWQVFLTAFGGVLVGAVLVAAVLYAAGVFFPRQETQPAPTEPTGTTAATDPSAPAQEPAGVETLVPSGKNDILNKVSYTVADGQADQWSDKVIATVGDAQLTNAQLQYLYWSGVIDFLNNYTYYLSAFGLDYTKPLDQQMAMEGNMTWEHFFLETALLTWHKYVVLNQDAAANGYQLPEDVQKTLDSLPQQLEALLADSECQSVDQLLKSDMGPVCTEEAYYSYMDLYFRALEYFDALYLELEPTEQEILKFFDENEETFAQSGITDESGSYYDVRHILIAPQGGTESADGTMSYTDEQWEACRQEAQAILDQWLAEDGTEAGFAALAVEKSSDPGSAQNGGLYENLTAETNFVDSFKQWYMDEARKPGDSGLVQSSHGYHIMYFSGSEQIWYYEAEAGAHQQKANDLVQGMMEQNPMEVTYENIAIGSVELG